MDACAFWKTFCDVELPDPSEGMSDDDLDAAVAHAERCEDCGKAVSPLFDLLERELGGSLKPDDARSRRAANLLIIVLTHPSQTAVPKRDDT